MILVMLVILVILMLAAVVVVVLLLLLDEYDFECDGRYDPIDGISVWDMGLSS